MSACCPDGLAMGPFGWFTRWRQRRTLARQPLPRGEWRRVVQRIPCLRGLSADELDRLRELVVLFLDRKTLNGVQGLQLTRAMRLQIAAQACLPILNLGLAYYDGWQEIVVYPDSFRVRRPVSDDIGLVSERDEVLSGEAWERGPVILSWSDIQYQLDQRPAGPNVIVHEFAHKLDMLNGTANGMPPLHAAMKPQAWTAALGSAYQALQYRLEHHQPGGIDAYGATSPAEFFAVLSEYFFTAPSLLLHDLPGVYRQLQAFYRQDPVSRLPRSSAA
jgi:Mlc titration factor MtfA (ptsG expression regulator)